MTYVDDLYEPGDDREPEPCEWYPAPEPVDLDEVEQRVARLEFLSVAGVTRVDLTGAQDLTDLRELIGQDVPGLIANLRQAREELARWEALEKREEWALSADRTVVPGRSYFKFPTSDMAFRYVATHQRQVWRRTVTVGPWEPIDSQPPF